MQSFTLPKNVDRTRHLARIDAFMASLAMGRGWVVEIKELRPKRTDAQNRYLRGVCYPAISKHLEGWETDDIHEYCLGECFGWEKLEGLGRTRLRPLKRSSKLSVTEFMDYIAWMQRHFAGFGIYIPEPNEEMA